MSNTEPQIFVGPASAKQEMFLNSGATITLCGGAAGSGKALRHGEKVLTPVGFVSIESIQVGDRVTTPANTVETVTGVYPQGQVAIYKVTFQDGATVDCCGDHLWQYHVARGHGTIKVSTTRELLTLLQNGKRPIVPLISPVDFPKKQLPVAPYTLGVLLGDGSLTTSSVNFMSLDAEIPMRVSTEGYDIVEWNKNEKRTLAKTYGVHKVQAGLRELSLFGLKSNTKFIPEVYKTSSIEDRWAIVQGLMDTDGYVCAGGNTYYYTVSKQLALDMQEILRSLGFTAKIGTKQTSYKNTEGEKVAGQLCYTLYIRGKLQSKLFSISRKKDRTKEKDVGNRIIKIEKIAEDLATCISVSGPDKLFITSNYIVTHNTFVSLLIALKFMQAPRATGVIFRRNRPMLTAPGSIWHEAVALYQSIYPEGLRIRHRDMEIIFPNGSLLKFSHMQYESNMYDHKGAQYSLVIFDEATDFTEPMIVYLLSRMRNAYVGHSPQMFLMTNPDFNSFLRLWIQDYYLDSRGIPIHERAGNKRWFYRQGNTMIWYASKEEAEQVHGVGDDNGVSSFAFIGATCVDNPPLLKAQPDYITKLKNMERVEMERLLLGSWFARLESTGLFKREWCELVPYPNQNAKQRVRAWDFAFSKPSEIYPDPDYTAGVLISKDARKVYTVEDVVRMRDRVYEVEKLIFDTAKADGKGTIISIPIDPNAAAGAYARDMQRKLSELGYICRTQKPVKSKVTRFAPFSSIAQAKFVQVVVGGWNKDFFEELEIFDGEGKTKDDQVDACSDCMSILNKGYDLPAMQMPELGSPATPQLRAFAPEKKIISLPTFNI